MKVRREPSFDFEMGELKYLAVVFSHRGAFWVVWQTLTDWRRITVQRAAFDRAKFALTTEFE